MRLSPVNSVLRQKTKQTCDVTKEIHFDNIPCLVDGQHFISAVKFGKFPRTRHKQNAFKKNIYIIINRNR